LKMSVFSIIRMMYKAVSSSETLVNIYQTTWYNILEDSGLRICHHKNLKSHPIYF
jgi:hypothetical protein